jgi:hypothetical protein
MIELKDAINVLETEKISIFKERSQRLLEMDVSSLS